jgi:protein-tyrosine phosphatase
MTTRVLFVCLGNICRSPTAEAVFQHLIEAKGLQELVSVDSAGTGSWHIGESPDDRTQDAALVRGIDMSKQRARQVSSNDFLQFDYLLAMDRQNLDSLVRMQPQEHDAIVDLFMNFSIRGVGEEVPDPYYGGVNGFNIVLDMIEEASHGLITSILASHDAGDSA